MTPNPEIKARVTRFVQENFIMSRAESLRGDDSLIAQHVIDSTGVIELVCFLEEQFGIRIEDDEMHPENLDSLDGIERFVQRKLAALPAAVAA